LNLIIGIGSEREEGRGMVIKGALTMRNPRDEDPSIERMGAKAVRADEALLKAAMVIDLTPHIREYLSDTDPKALAQLEQAIDLAEGKTFGNTVEAV
jgi:hypothetical protein